MATAEYRGRTADNAGAAARDGRAAVSASISPALDLGSLGPFFPRHDVDVQGKHPFEPVAAPPYL